MPTPPDDEVPAFPVVARAVDAAVARNTAEDDPLGSVVALTELIEFLQAQIRAVTVRRDELLAPLITVGISHRQLAKKLGMSRQRIDQLAKIAAAGRRPGR